MTVPTLAPNALTSVDNAKLWLRRNNVVSVGDDDLLTLAINGVSNHIQKYTERQFFTESSATKIFKYAGSGFLSLSPYEARTITSVTMGGATLTAADGSGAGSYFAEPRNKTMEGTYLFLSLIGYFNPNPWNSLYAPVANERDVTVIGDWGMSAVPGDVELACLIGVSDFYRNPESGGSRSSDSFQMVEAPRNPGSDSALPDGALDLLEPYIRPKVR